MMTNKELTADLSDRSIDLSIYHPEKALHLEYKNVTDNIKNQIESFKRRIDFLESERIQQRKAMIQRILAKYGLDRKSFARKMFKYYPDRNNFSMFCKKHIYPFIETGISNDDGLESKSVISNMQRLFWGFEDALKSDEQLNLEEYCKYLSLQIDSRYQFIRNFKLLWEHRENICNTPELANIRIRFAGHFVEKNHIAKLGELLLLYHHGEFRYGENCPHCDSEMLIYVTVGISTYVGVPEMGFRSGFCPKCGYIAHNTTGHSNCYYAFDRIQLPHPQNETCWTLPDLIEALKPGSVMKTNYAHCHEPTISGIHNSRELIIRKIYQLKQEFDEAHSDEYDELFCRKSRDVWQYHVMKLNAKPKRKAKKLFWGDESLIATTKACEELGEQRRRYVMNALDKYVHEVLQINTPYDYVEEHEICINCVTFSIMRKTIERRLYQYIDKICEMHLLYTSQVNNEYKKMMDNLNHQMIQIKKELTQFGLECQKSFIHRSGNELLVKELRQIRKRMAQVKVKIIFKIRELLLYYAKEELHLEGNFIVGYIYYLTPYPDLK